MPKKQYATNYYQVLQVHPLCSHMDIRKAYRKLAMSLHPDVNPNANTQAFALLKEAYEVLNNPTTRQAFHQQFFATHLALQETTLPQLMQQATQLQQYIHNSNTYNIDYQVLYLYLNNFIGPTHASLLQTATAEQQASLFQSLHQAAALLPYALYQNYAGQLQTQFPAQHNYIAQQLKQKKRLAQWHQYKIWVALILAILFCIIIANAA